MAPLTSLLTVALCSSTAAFSATKSGIATTSRPSTKLYENFGFDFAEDQVENTPQIILGEANYKTWLNGVDPDNFMNRQVSYINMRYIMYCEYVVFFSLYCNFIGSLWRVWQ